MALAKLELVLPVTGFGEYSAIKSTGQLVDTVDNAELRQGYMAQMIDEIRHTNQVAHLTRYLAKHAPGQLAVVGQALGGALGVEVEPAQDALGDRHARRDARPDRLAPIPEDFSARSGDGMAAWLQWLDGRMAPLPAQAHHVHA